MRNRETPLVHTCPDCGTDLEARAPEGDLCPRCLLELALDVKVLEAETEVSGEAPTIAAPDGSLSEGDIQGERYRIRSLLGRGGMGEVWRAYDLKLRQDVALKSLLTEGAEGKKVGLEEVVHREQLREEVRVAREVISPNVCRVFDLQEVDGRELVSMEYIDGTTLIDILEERSPLDLEEAREIASQFLAGLEAVHDAGLVHRDIKPENIMVTRSGRVVVMDFGIAKGLGTGKGEFAGTPAYMSPEQRQGGELDARADIFSAGIVLAEMVDPVGVRSSENRKRVWEAIHQDEPVLADTPWASVLRSAVAVEREERFEDAKGLARALEEVTLRAAGEREGDPYPGLAPFTRERAKYFFGRELEVESLWKKLRRPHLLALIAPSGSGKSSFLQAGLLPALPDNWGVLTLKPGNSPFIALSRAMVGAIDGDRLPVEDLMRFDDPDVTVDVVGKWRSGFRHGLVVVDQFEELFTQNPEEEQARFADLLARLPLEADTFVLLSMREDFFYRCQQFESLSPVFSELMPLGPLSGNSLRRALVQPALKCGYRFEDESLVDEMVEEVSHERGALPLLAFAAARLWELRDRASGLLTRETYTRIGGVAGALAQHAEDTLKRIGDQGIPIVRELFRNLVTADGTRAARDREELLSVFSEANQGQQPEASSQKPGHGSSAAFILDTLINARLLTSYEITDGDRTTARVEIVHESLLANWPRLVRWQRQDAEGAKLRDELRHQARVWDEKGQPEDLLWVGTAYREYQLWRERYPGGLTRQEDEFARSMTAKAERRKRRRRLALTTAFVVLAAVLAVMATLWWRGELARREAVAEARRAEASKLLALGRLEFESNPTEALAYATRSLELSDTLATRRFALETLWQGPSAFVLDEETAWGALFSPDGAWLASGWGADQLKIWPRRGGEPLRIPAKGMVPLGFTADSRLLVTQQKRVEDSLRIWSVADGNLVNTFPMAGDLAIWNAYLRPEAETVTTLEVPATWDRIVWKDWPVPSGESRDLGAEGMRFWVIDCPDPAGRWLGWGTEHEVEATLLSRARLEEPAKIGRHEATFTGCALDSRLGMMASIDEQGRVRIWRLDPPAPAPLRRLEVGTPVGARSMTFAPDGRRLAAGGGDQITRIWDLEGPPDAAPQVLRRGKIDHILSLSFDPRSEWLVTGESAGTVLWPMGDRRSFRLAGHSAGVSALDFTPDGTWLLSASFDRTVRRWPLAAAVAESGEVAFTHGASLERLTVDPSGERLAWAGSGDGPYVSSQSGEMVELMGMTFMPDALAWDEAGRWVASGGGHREAADAKILLWDLEGGEVEECATWEGSCLEPSIVLDAGDELGVSSVEFLSNGDLLAAGAAGLRRWSAEQATYEQLVEEPATSLLLLPDQRSVILLVGDRSQEARRIVVFDLVEQAERSLDLSRFGEQVTTCAVDPMGEILACGDRDGVVRVGRWADGEPHWLLGHTGSIQSLAISPDGRWIATGSADRDIRLWPMPDFDVRPLHALPLETLLAKLGSLTNLHVVEDPESETGWSVGIGPFPGWDELPIW